AVVAKEGSSRARELGKGALNDHRSARVAEIPHVRDGEAIEIAESRHGEDCLAIIAVEADIVLRSGAPPRRDALTGEPERDGAGGSCSMRRCYENPTKRRLDPPGSRERTRMIVAARSELVGDADRPT